jgi:hypothetical protein
MVVLTFRREADMTPRLLRAAASFGCADWPTFLEFEGPQGIADVVFARFSDTADAVRRSTPLARPIIAWREAAVVCALDDCTGRPLLEIAMRARLAEATARATLRSLAAEGAAVQDGSRWLLAAPCPSPLEEAVAVELKLSDWRRALGQAVRYSRFAHRSYVVLADGHTAAATAARDAFRLHNVGLAGLSPWGSVALVTRPRRRRPFDPIARFLAGERLWQAQQSQLQHVAALGEKSFPD